MSEYKKLDEIFPDGYGDGRKFVSDTNTDYWFVPYFQDRMGRWHASDYSNDHFVVYEHVDVREWFPPKQTKKVKMYCPIYKGTTGTITGDCYHSDKNYFGQCANVIGWLEMTCEVTE